MVVDFIFAKRVSIYKSIYRAIDTRREECADNSEIRAKAQNLFATYVNGTFYAIPAELDQLKETTKSWSADEAEFRKCMGVIQAKGFAILIVIRTDLETATTKITTNLGRVIFGEPLYSGMVKGIVKQIDDPNTFNYASAVAISAQETIRHADDEYKALAGFDEEMQMYEDLKSAQQLGDFDASALEGFIWGSGFTFAIVLDD